MKCAREKSCARLWRVCRRNERSMRVAAVGFRVHSVCAEKGGPRVLARDRVHLVEEFSYRFRQPYHTAERMKLEEAREFVKRVEAEAERLAFRAISAAQSDLQKQGIQLKRCGLLLASG